jgi:NIMA (never in mitosis gene a)-related kinase
MSSLTNFKVLEQIGDGSYSKVYKVQRLADDQFYAMKQVKVFGMTEKEKENSLNEVRILASL